MLDKSVIGFIIAAALIVYALKNRDKAEMDRRQKAEMRRRNNKNSTPQ